MPYGHPIYAPARSPVGIPIKQGFVPASTGWSPSDIPQSEADALVAFHAATGGDSWTTGWTFSGPAGDLNGVTVSGGHVTVISLGANNLTTTGASIDLTALQLTQTGVDAVLSDMVTSAGTGATLDISGTNAAPSGAGITDAETLVAAGWTVTMSATLDSTVTSSAYIATKDGEAMFFADAQDFSAYANTATMVRLIDSAGAVADAYAGSAGGGETLGSVLNVSDCVNKGDSWGYDTFDGVSSTGFHAINTTEYGLGGSADEIDVTSGELVKTVVSVSLSSGSYPAWSFRKGYSDYTTIAGDPITLEGGNNTQYWTITETTTGCLFISIGNDVATEFTASDLAIKKLTDIPATGLHLVSTSGGSTRNMASVETGFDPKDITTIEFWSV